jgi:galactose mutarotase-like enzyme
MSVEIASPELRATVSETGAELVRLQDRDGKDLLWSGDPKFWGGHAPLLFPVVGSTRDDRVLVDGRAYPMPRHGIARISRFDQISREAARCQWRLISNDRTLAHYPFPFSLELSYEIVGSALKIRATVTNTGERAMPVSFGFHPAFCWPLPYGQARSAHEIRFEKDEPFPIRRLENGLLGEVRERSPVVDGRLALRDDLFESDAVIFDQMLSRSVTYGAGSSPSIEVSFSEMPQLGIWSKAGAGFICIEPWHGFASPVGFDDDLLKKPGIVMVQPASPRSFAMTIIWHAAA